MRGRPRKIYFLISFTFVLDFLTAFRLTFFYRNTYFSHRIKYFSFSFLGHILFSFRLLHDNLYVLNLSLRYLCFSFIPVELMSTLFYYFFYLRFFCNKTMQQSVTQCSNHSVHYLHFNHHVNTHVSHSLPVKFFSIIWQCTFAFSLYEND